MSSNNGQHFPDEEQYLITPRKQAQEEEEIADDFLNQLDVFRLLTILKKNIIWLLLLPTLCLAAGFIFLRYTKPLYESTSSLRLQVKSEANILGLQGTGAVEDVTSNLSGEIELIKSNLIYDAVINKIDLAVSYYAKGDILDEEKYKSSPFRVAFKKNNEAVYDRVFNVHIIDSTKFELDYKLGDIDRKGTYSFGKEFNTGDFVFTLKLSPSFSADLYNTNYYFIVNSHGALSQYLASNMRVDILNPSANILGISFKDYNITKARDIVNTIDTVYLEKTLELKNKANKQKIDFLEEQLQATEKKLEGYELMHEDFVVKNKTADVHGEVDKYIGKIEELLQEKLALNTQLSLLKELQKLITNESSLTEFIPSLPLLPDPQLVSLTEEVNRLQKDRSLLLTTSTEATAAVQSKNKAIATTKANLLTLIDRNRELVQKKVSQASAKQQEFENTFVGLPSKGTQYTRIQRFKELYEKYYLLIMDRKAEIGIAEAGIVPEFDVLSTASLPRVPIYPNRMMVYAVCGAIGFFFSFLLIGVKYIRHNTISDQRDIEKTSSAPLLGVIPSYKREKLSVSKLVIDKHPKAAISEALRSVRTNLEFVLPIKKRKKIISVTSTVSGEGKTFVSLNLAGVIAMSSAKVVLLDLDMRKPKIHLAFDNENFKGISTILIGRHSWKECIHKTPIPAMDYITAGPTPPNPAELILRPEFDLLLKDLHEHYDIILIDTPPVGLVTDGILVMRKADLSVYVIRADYSKRAFIKNVNKLRNYHKFNSLALILNDFKDLQQYGYGYGSGYGYGYGYGGYYEVDDEKTTPVERVKSVLTKFNKVKS